MRKLLQVSFIALLLLALAVPALAACGGTMYVDAMKVNVCEEDDTPRTVAPVEQSLDVNDLPDGEYPEEFDRGIVETIQTSENEEFDQYNTTVRMEDGKVAEIVRVYVS